MKRKLITGLLITLILIAFSACSNGSNSSSGGNGTVPVLTKAFITNVQPTSENLNTCPQLSQVNQNQTYYFVVDFYDPDMDVCNFQYSFYNFNTSHDIFTRTINQQYEYQFNYIDDFGNFANSGSANVSVYVTDNKGNKSNTLSISFTIQ